MTWQRRNHECKGIKEKYLRKVDQFGQSWELAHLIKNVQWAGEKQGRE